MREELKKAVLEWYEAEYSVESDEALMKAIDKYSAEKEKQND